jgi:hypothetical protein
MIRRVGSYRNFANVALQLQEPTTQRCGQPSVTSGL